MNDFEKEFLATKKDEAARDKKRKGESIASVAGRAAREANIVRRFLFQLIQGIMWTWDNILNPVWTFVTWPFAKFFWKHYRHLWDRIVYVKDEYDVTHFSKSRAGYMVTVTLFLAFFSWNMLWFTFDSALYFTTVQQNQVVYLSNSQEIIPESDIHSVQGCEVGADAKVHSCDETNSLYYRVEPSWFNTVWALAAGHGFFMPDLVAGAVGTNWSKCTVTSYGIRLRLFVGWLNFYPKMLNAKCEPVALNVAFASGGSF